MLVVCGAYWVGGRVASEKYRAEFANQTNTQAYNLINLQGDINAETNYTTTVDIRRRLYDKYTIQD